MPHRRYLAPFRGARRPRSRSSAYAQSTTALPPRPIAATAAMTPSPSARPIARTSIPTPARGYRQRQTQNAGQDAASQAKQPPGQAPVQPWPGSSRDHAEPANQGDAPGCAILAQAQSPGPAWQARRASSRASSARTSHCTEVSGADITGSYSTAPKAKFAFACWEPIPSATSPWPTSVHYSDYHCHTARRTTRRKSSAAGKAIAPAIRPRRGVGGPSPFALPRSTKRGLAALKLAFSRRSARRIGRPDKKTRLAALGLGRDAYRANPGSPKMMTRLIAAAALIAAITAPALACEWNKSAGANSQSTVASQSSGAQQSKPVQQHKRS